MTLVWCYPLGTCLQLSQYLPLINIPISEADSRFYKWKVLRKLQTQSHGDVQAHATQRCKRFPEIQTSKHIYKHLDLNMLQTTTNKAFPPFLVLEAKVVLHHLSKNSEKHVFSFCHIENKNLKTIRTLFSCVVSKRFNQSKT